MRLVRAAGSRGARQCSEPARIRTLRTGVRTLRTIRVSARPDRAYGPGSMDDDAPVVDEHQLAARALAWLFAAGASLALLWVLLPHDPRANDAALVAVVLAFSAVAAVTWLAQRRLGVRDLDVLVGLSTVLVSAAIYGSGAPTSAFALLYSWAVLHAFHYLPVRHAVGQLVF